jgi:hypothetical protein
LEEIIITKHENISRASLILPLIHYYGLKIKVQLSSPKDKKWDQRLEKQLIFKFPKRKKINVGTVSKVILRPPVLAARLLFSKTSCLI